MSIDAGELNRLIRIMRRDTGTDAANQPLRTWSQWRKRWAKILGATGMAAVRAAEQGIPLAPGKYSFRVRYLEGVTTADRVDYRGVIYDIRDVRHDLAGREHTDLVCETGTSNG